MKKSSSRLLGFIGLAVSFLGVFLSGRFLAALFHIPRRAMIDRFPITAAVSEWVPAIAIVSLIIFAEKRTLASIGIKKTSLKDCLWGIAGFAAGIFTFAVTIPIVTALHLESTRAGINLLAHVSLGYRIIIVLTAGICEEILFRGYAIERIAELTGSLKSGAVIAWLIFTLGHVYLWRIGGAIQIGVWAIVVTALYIWRRNLLSCMIMHILNDGFALILIPSFHR